jgi:hypothetical protein
LGFAPFQGTLARASNAVPFELTLLPNAQNLKAVEVKDRAPLNGLERSGFYDRMLEVQRGAPVGEFFTPEDLDARPAAKISSILAASKYAKVSRFERDSDKISPRPSTVIQGARNCYMNILLDGIRIGQPGDGFRPGPESIDDILSVASVSGIEVYRSVADAPMSIASKLVGGDCGIVAIWTGARR